MTELLKSIILGIVQGATEFLPISSSGHLAILHKVLGFETESNLFFDVVLHFATLLAVVIYYRKKIMKICVAGLNSIKVFFKGKDGLKNLYKSDEDFRFLIFIIVGSIPTAIMGLFLEDKFEVLADNLLYVGLALLVTAILLTGYELKKNANRDVRQMGFIDAILIGIVQGFAITPGISRSGSTIATAKMSGIKKETAANFSFLLSIPAVFGAFLLKLKDVLDTNMQFDFTVIIAGFVASFITGYLCLKLLIWLIKKANLKVFAVYCTIVGVITILNSI